MSEVQTLYRVFGGVPYHGDGYVESVRAFVVIRDTDKTYVVGPHAQSGAMSQRTIRKGELEKLREAIFRDTNEIWTDNEGEVPIHLDTLRDRYQAILTERLKWVQNGLAKIAELREQDGFMLSTEED